METSGPDEGRLASKPGRSAPLWSLVRTGFILGRVDGYRKMEVKGFPNHFFGESWVAGFWRAGHADQDDRGRLGACARCVRCLPLAAWGQGAGRPQVLSLPKGLEALHYFAVHNITWQALAAEFGSWNRIWKRFWRLSRSGVFETFFEALASLSERAHLV